VLKEFEIAGYDMPCVDLAVNVDVFPKPNGGTGINAMSWQGGGKVPAWWRQPDWELNAP
jgi:hypothetical protein